MERLVIVNFNAPLSIKLKQEIAAILHIDPANVEEKHFNVGINMRKNIYIQCVDIVDKIEIDKLPVDVVVNLPGLPIAAVYLLNEIEARAGFKPQILELHREKDPTGNIGEFHFGKIRSLQHELDCSREKYKYKNSR